MQIKYGQQEVIDLWNARDNLNAERARGRPQTPIHGWLGNLVLDEEAKPSFDALVRQLHKDFRLTKLPDFIQAELVGIYRCLATRLDNAGEDEEASLFADLIQGHLRDLKATRLDRNNEAVAGGKMSFIDFCSLVATQHKKEEHHGK